MEEKNEFLTLVEQAVGRGASDLFIVAGQKLSCKVGREIVPLGENKAMPDLTGKLVREAYALAGRDTARLDQGDDDFAISVPGFARLRMSAYRQRGSLAAVVRVVSFAIPDYRAMHIPETVMRVAQQQKGLVLVSGAAGSGKSTTLACLIDRINHSRSGHIITIEDPIEYLYRSDRCIISQRELGTDIGDYAAAVRASLRQAPDVILLGELRDAETIRTAITAAETGHLIFSTLHTRGAASTVERILDAFPAAQQAQVRLQLAMQLHAVISQQLVPVADGTVVPVFEVMYVNPAIRNLIRENKLHQIDSVIATGAAEGMLSMDAGLTELVRQGQISEETAVGCAVHPELMAKRFK